MSLSNCSQRTKFDGINRAQRLRLSRGELMYARGRFNRRLPASGGLKSRSWRRVALPPAYQEHPVLLRDHDYSRGGGGDEWIAIHSNGIHTNPLQWTAAWIGLVSNALESIAYQCNSSPATAPSRHPPGEKDKTNPGVVSLQFR